MTATQRRYDASRHFTAKPDGNGGVRLSLRAKFRDQGTSFLPGSNEDNEMGSYLGDDGIARSGPVGDQDNGSSKIEQTICVFTPAPGSTYHFEKLDNGTIRVVLVSDPSELIGDTVTGNMGSIPMLNQGPSATTDRLARFVSSRRGSEASKLRSLNAIHRAWFNRS